MFSLRVYTPPFKNYSVFSDCAFLSHGTISQMAFPSPSLSVEFLSSFKTDQLTHSFEIYLSLLPNYIGLGSATYNRNLKNSGLKYRGSRPELKWLLQEIKDPSCHPSLVWDFHSQGQFMEKKADKLQSLCPTCRYQERVRGEVRGPSPANTALFKQLLTRGLTPSYFSYIATPNYKRGWEMESFLTEHIATWWHW